MAKATLIGVGNSAALTIPKRFRARNGLERGDEVSVREMTPTKIVIDVIPAHTVARSNALARAFDLAEELDRSSGRPFPDDGAVREMLADRDA